MYLRYSFYGWFSLLVSIFLTVSLMDVHAATGLHTYANSSVLAQGQWSKIQVSSTGFYKISFDDLKKMGVTDPSKVKICGYGGALLPEDFSKPFIDDLPENAIYIGSNYILFYAQGATSWQYQPATKTFVHTQNYYSNYGYYFVQQGTAPARQITPLAPETGTPTDSVASFLDYDVHEADLVNLATSGREFYGEQFGYTTSYTFPFTFPNADGTRQGTAVVNVAAKATVASSFSVNLGSALLGNLVVPALAANMYAMSGNGSYKFTPASDNSSISLTYNKSTDVATGYLNFIEMNVYRKLIMTGSYMPFRNPDYVNQNRTLKYSLSGANANVKIWNLTDPQNIVEMPVVQSNGTLSFVTSAPKLQEYAAIDPTQANAFPSAVIVQTGISNQNLHALTAQDMVIISPAAFTGEAERLAQEHRDHDNMRVAVVSAEQIYNEFSSGNPDATAYRKLMKMLYDRAGGFGTPDAPKYLLLFGRGFFDNRNITKTSLPIPQLMSFESYNSLSQLDSYVSDDYFGFLDDNSGVNLTADKLNIGVGRFPIYTQEQAKATVDKTITYVENGNRGSWKNQVCFVADHGDDNLHMTQADSLASYASRAYPMLQINKIYLDAFQQVITPSATLYPTANNKLLNLIQSGLLILNYTGHGSPDGWSTGQVLTGNNINNLYNNKLALWVTATCDFTRCDYTSITGGENVFLNPNGGGIALFTTTRTVISSSNFLINSYFETHILQLDASGNYLRLGDVMRLTKNDIPGDNNKMNFIYIGDPAIRLAAPAPNYPVVTDFINDVAASTANTVSALSLMTIKGHVNVPDNSGVCTDFNGYVEVTVYDKIQTITTLTSGFTYQDRPNILFSGKTYVKNGYFTIQSIVPKDIDYSFGSGRISYYATDTLGREGQGSYTNFMVGGSNNNIVWEYNGPDVDMYLNTPDFKSGDKVNETPLFVANVSDETGINIVGSGIGHDMTLSIDQNPSMYYPVNDYFTPSMNDYRSGTVQYRLPALADGKHTLTFRVWDVLNNSTVKSIDFEVQKGLAPELFSVTCYPNPAKGAVTNFVLNHDRPNTILQVGVSVYDLTGRLLKTLQTSTPSATSTVTIPWDVTDSSGNRLPPGIYLYKMNVSTTNGNSASKTQKIIVAGQ